MRETFVGTEALIRPTHKAYNAYMSAGRPSPSRLMQAKPQAVTARVWSGARENEANA